MSHDPRTRQGSMSEHRQNQIEKKQNNSERDEVIRQIFDLPQGVKFFNGASQRAPLGVVLTPCHGSI